MPTRAFIGAPASDIRDHLLEYRIDSREAIRSEGDRRLVPEPKLWCDEDGRRLGLHGYWVRQRAQTGKWMLCGGPVVLFAFRLHQAYVRPDKSRTEVEAVCYEEAARPHFDALVDDIRLFYACAMTETPWRTNQTAKAIGTPAVAPASAPPIEDLISAHNVRGQQAEVARLLSKDHSAAQIAQRLGIKPKTVENIKSQLRNINPDLAPYRPS